MILNICAVSLTKWKLKRLEVIKTSAVNYSSTAKHKNQKSILWQWNHWITDALNLKRGLEAQKTTIKKWTSFYAPQIQLKYHNMIYQYIHLYLHYVVNTRKCQMICGKKRDLKTNLFWLQKASCIHFVTMCIFYELSEDALLF